MGSDGFNLVSVEKFDEALNNINSLSSCNISSAMSTLSNGGVSSRYSAISSGIANIKDAISRLANGAGPEGLIDNYKAGYNGIKNAIIESYVAEYEFALENGNIMSNASALKNMSASEKEKFLSELGSMLKNMGQKASSTDTLLQFASLTEFFKEVENAFSKYSVSLNDIASDISNLQPKNNRDIAHRGYTPGGILDNSAEGFRLAGEKGFWGCETDVRFDSNGNLVCSHNAVKNGQNPTTFEEYLDICKEYGMTAIIDLKYEKGVGPADANLSPAVLKVIQEKGMMDSCVLQTNNPTDIPYIRQNSSNARIWYLTDVISDNNLKLIEDNNVECVNARNTKVSDNSIKKLIDNGVDVCVWNVETETTKNRLLNLGATYVMSDNVLGITPYQTGDQNLNDLRFNLDEKIEPILLDADANTVLNADAASNVTNTNNVTNVTNTSSVSTSGVRLTAPMGHINGPEAYETWYDEGMSNVVEKMEKLYGYTNLKSSVRSDGVKVLSGTAPDGTTFNDLVMVAADVRHESANPNGTYERGQIVDTTLGKGIVVDACGEAIRKRENNEGVHFDIATAWHTKPYQSQAYSKENMDAYKEYAINQANKTNTSNSSTNLSSNVSSVASVKNGTTSSSNVSSSESSSNSSSASVNLSSSNSGSTVDDILPSKKFPDVIPQISSGNLGSVETGKNSIIYELYNVSENAYSDYVKALIDKGYTMTDYGKFVKDNCEVITNITNDGNMSISLIQN